MLQVGNRVKVQAKRKSTQYLNNQEGVVRAVAGDQVMVMFTLDTGSMLNADECKVLSSKRWR